MASVNLQGIVFLDLMTQLCTFIEFAHYARFLFGATLIDRNAALYALCDVVIDV